MEAGVVAFTKMHGAGNDYIYVDTMRHPLRCPSELAAKWSTPHTGIGSDGLVLIGPSRVADFSMRIFNADGSEALMCGNAARCVGKYVHDKGLTDRPLITLETLSGIRRLSVRGGKGGVECVTVDMGIPTVVDAQLRVVCGGLSFLCIAVSMGNPHLVVLVDDVAKVDLEGVGPLLERCPTFPDRTNVEFAHIRGVDEIRMRVWERGSGVTQACGTGACATAVAAMVRGLTSRTVRVYMDGGSLDVWWEPDGPAWMTGGAVTVFEGTIKL
ncbi:Diaminopimelate epimerase [Novymonas esmeraldas]|uniref:diaminopimelate epimerase n=1 Tax=Novymonas esmeraldas TaxID=1808958 RepID=A0AAW0ETU2_9TRYP